MVGAALAAMFYVVAAVGARQAARGERVLGVLEPAAAWVAASGCRVSSWAVGHGVVVGWAITLVAVAVAAAGAMFGLRQALPVCVLAAAVTSAAWGQILILGDRPAVGVWFHVAGCICAVALGVARPLRSLSGISAPDGADTASALQARRHWAWEAVLVLALSLVGLLVRMYALTELPRHFEAEMVVSMIMSASAWSLAAYFQRFFLNVSAGIVHMLPGPAVFSLFGASLYGIRLVSVLFGYVAIPLAYALARRVAGVGAAVIVAILVMVAPEQLYWSRIETGCFAPVFVFGLISAHLGLWFVRRLSVWAVLAGVLWMPVSRYCYASCWPMLAYPILLYAHAVVCVRGAWRKAWYVVPLLSAGVAAWIFSLSVAWAAVTREPWHFVHPAILFGAPLWRQARDPAFEAGTLTEWVCSQAGGLMATVAKAWTSVWIHDPQLNSQWFACGCLVPKHSAFVSAPIAAALVLGIGYVLGQVRSRRAAVLLLWMVLGLTPGVVSGDPSIRRLSTLFPPVYVTVGVFVAAALAVARAAAGRWPGRLATTAVGVAVLAVAHVNLAGHLALPAGSFPIARAISFARPLLERQDLVLHDLDDNILPILLGDLDVFLAAPSCLRRLEPDDQLQGVVSPACDFDGNIYDFTIPPARRAAQRRGYQPRFVSFLIEETAESVPLLQLLHDVYPRAEIRRSEFPGYGPGPIKLVSVTVDRTDVAAIGSPTVLLGAGLDHSRPWGTGVLRDVALAPADGETSGERGLVVRGGVLVERDGWYDFGVEPACSHARLTIDGRLFPAGARPPMRAGVHEFEFALADPAACRLPVDMVMRSQAADTMIAVPPSRLTSSKVLDVPAARPAEVSIYDGYGEARVAAAWKTEVGVDVGIDAAGRITALLTDPKGFHLQRYDRDGRETARWSRRVSVDSRLAALETDSAGRSVLVLGDQVAVFDPEGREVGNWRITQGGYPADVALTADGHLLLTAPMFDAVTVYTLDGGLLGQIGDLAGGRRRLTRPMAVTAGPQGRLLIVEEYGQALVARIEGDVLHPVLEREFRALRTDRPVSPFGAAFDGTERVLLPDPFMKAPLVFGARGERLMAARGERDLGAKSVGPILRFVAVGGQLYVLTATTLWRLDS